MGKAGAVLGIDFGTTNTNAAWVDRKGNLHLVPVSEKSYVMPSVIWFRARDKFVIGNPARQQIIDDPTHTVFGSKRFLGRSFRSHFVARNKDRFGYELCEGPGGMAAIRIHGQVVTITEIASRIIFRMVELASAAAGFDFEEVVLTVPAHFGHAQRHALRTAAEMAGLEVRGLVNEPTAAALYCAKRKGVEQTIMVYDLGGGTFDISLVAIRGQLVLVLATGGDAFLGGADFDAQIARRLVTRFEHEHGVDVQSNVIVMQRLNFAAEQAKIALSREEEVVMRVPFVAQAQGRVLDFEHVLNRDALETLTSNLIEGTLGACEELLRRAEMREADVGELVFVGGQTRMLALQRRLAAAFHTDPGKNINPELGVAVGAAILGRGLDLPAGPELVDVVSIPIGVVLQGSSAQEVIPRNTGVPCVRRVNIDQRPPPDTPLVIGVYEALDPRSVEREFLGTLRVEPEWLVQHPGDLALEMRLGQDFELSAAVAASDGSRISLELLPTGTA